MYLWSVIMEDYNASQIPGCRLNGKIACLFSLFLSFQRTIMYFLQNAPIFLSGCLRTNYFTTEHSGHHSNPKQFLWKSLLKSIFLYSFLDQQLSLGRRDSSPAVPFEPLTVPNFKGQSHECSIAGLLFLYSPIALKHPEGSHLTALYRMEAGSIGFFIIGSKMSWMHAIVLLGL